MICHTLPVPQPLYSRGWLVGVDYGVGMNAPTDPLTLFVSKFLSQSFDWPRHGHWNRKLQHCDSGNAFACLCPARGLQLLMSFFQIRCQATGRENLAREVQGGGPELWIVNLALITTKTLFSQWSFCADRYRIVASVFTLKFGNRW